MRIIENGNLGNCEKMKKCNNCKCLYTYLETDIIQTTLDGFDICDGLKCPFCGEINAVSIFDKKYKEEWK